MTWVWLRKSIARGPPIWTTICESRPISPLRTMPSGLDELGEPAPGVVDVHRDAGRADRGDDRVRVLEVRRERLVAEDAAGAVLDRGLDHAPVEVVRRHDRDDVGPFGLEHLAVVLVDLQAREPRRPALQERRPARQPRCRSRRRAPVRDGREGRGMAVRGRGAEGGSDAGPGASAEIQLRPTSAIRRLIDVPPRTVRGPGPERCVNMHFRALIASQAWGVRARNADFVDPASRTGLV